MPIEFEGTRQSVRTEEFSIRFAEPFLVTFIGTLAVLVGMCAQAGAVREYWLLLGVLPAFALVFCAVATAVMVWRYKFTVGPRGISSYDFWCRPNSIAWEEMTRVSRIWLPGLSYLRVRVAGTYRDLWLPMFIDEPLELARLVNEYAGPDHPLALALGKFMASEPADSVGRVV
ncbi:MAG: hypothetical protein R3B90_18525 [Planctomycetaceae bacterium]